MRKGVEVFAASWPWQGERAIVAFNPKSLVIAPPIFCNEPEHIARARPLVELYNVSDDQLPYRRLQQELNGKRRESGNRFDVLSAVDHRDVFEQLRSDFGISRSTCLLGYPRYRPADLNWIRPPDRLAVVAPVEQAIFVSPELAATTDFAGWGVAQLPYEDAHGWTELHIPVGAAHSDGNRVVIATCPVCGEEYVPIEIRKKNVYVEWNGAPVFRPNNSGLIIMLEDFYYSLDLAIRRNFPIRTKGACEIRS